MKKAHLSPVTSLLVSLSLVLGILVSDLTGYKFLTAVQAQSNSAGHRTISFDGVMALGGVEVRALFVNGRMVGRGVIAGPVMIADGTVNASGVIVGGVGSDTVSTSGVIVGGVGSGSTDGTVSKTGVIVGGVQGGTTDDSVSKTGVIVGGVQGGTTDDSVSKTGVIVGGIAGDDEAVRGGVVSVQGIARGGMLTGDDITVEDGVITGKNLVLTGATFHGGAINVSGGGATVRISPVD